MEPINIMSQLASLGAAGIMGALWLMERRLSRQREQQLTESHERIIRDEQRLDKLTRVVEHNSAAMTKFAENQREQTEVLRHLLEELHHERTS
ncbi:MAG: hypothetical protein HZA50_04410 [Planctomycetes bacterium]|nr:hypothetical protein [Planctomycetota bacterium]